jgi:hypothetical protein
MTELINKIEQLFLSESEISDFDIAPIGHELVTNLNSGKIRAAESVNGLWRVNEWVKKGILLLFKFGRLSNMSNEGIFSFFDKDTLPVHPFSLEDDVRIVPGGSSKAVFFNEAGENASIQMQSDSTYFGEFGKGGSYDYAQDFANIDAVVSYLDKYNFTFGGMD